MAINLVHAIGFINQLCSRAGVRLLGFVMVRDQMAVQFKPFGIRHVACARLFSNTRTMCSTGIGSTLLAAPRCGSPSFPFDLTLRLLKAECEPFMSGRIPVNQFPVDPHWHWNHWSCLGHLGLETKFFEIRRHVVHQSSIKCLCVGKSKSFLTHEHSGRSQNW